MDDRKGGLQGKMADRTAINSGTIHSITSISIKEALMQFRSSFWHRQNRLVSVKKENIGFYKAQ
jgi:hypothetical protein